MSKLVDPGKDLPPQAAKAERMKAWKRPTKKADRDKQRAERIAEAREAMQHDRVSVQRQGDSR